MRSTVALAELASFAVVLGVAWVEAWSPGDLAWGLWASSFLTIMLWLPLMGLLMMRQDGFDLVKAAGIVLGVGVAGWGVTWFYRFYGEMLDLGYPLIPDPGRVYVGGTTWRNVRPFALWPTLLAAVWKLYVVAILSLVPLIPGLRRAWHDPDRFRMDPGFRGGAFVRMHFTVMALAALQIATGDQRGRFEFLFTAAILTINYFPWEVFRFRSSVPPERLA